MNHLLLTLACIFLPLVIAAQDFLYIPLRNETISAGLTGPYHWWLDAAYLPLSIFLVLRFAVDYPVGPHPFLAAILACIAAIALIAVAVTNTFWRWVDGFTDEKHALWHSRFTIAVFISAIALQIVCDSGSFWIMTFLNFAIPGAAYFYFHTIPTTIKGVTIAASPAAEKLYTFQLCLWLIIF